MLKTLYINGCSHTAGVELDSWENGGPSWPKNGTIQDIPQHCYHDSWANIMGRNINFETLTHIQLQILATNKMLKKRLLFQTLLIFPFFFKFLL